MLDQRRAETFERRIKFRDKSSGSLVLKNVVSADVGAYVCEAENILGSVKVTARLDVQGELRKCLQKTRC